MIYFIYLMVLIMKWFVKWLYFIKRDYEVAKYIEWRYRHKSETSVQFLLSYISWNNNIEKKKLENKQNNNSI